MPLYARQLFVVVDILTEALAIAMLALAFGVVALGVAGRYVLVTPFPWTVEVGRFAFIWMCLGGIALAERRRAHFQITFITEAMPSQVGTVLAVIREIVVFTVLALFIVESIRFGRVGAEAFSSVLEIPLSYIYLALPVAAVLTAINRIRCILEGLVDPDIERPRIEGLAPGDSAKGGY